MESLTGNLISLARVRAGKFQLHEDLEDAALTVSLRQFGLLQPITVAANGNYYECISGHKRLHALKKLKKKSAPVHLLAINDPKELFLAALLLNHPAGYSDLERSRAIQKAEKDFHFSSPDLQNLILPLLGLPPSPKILKQYQKAAALPVSIHRLIQTGCLPFQGSFGLAKFKSQDLDFLRLRVFPQIRPSASQLAHICEWLLDLTQTQKRTVAEILKKGKPAVISKSQDGRAGADAFYQSLRSLRFPELACKEKAFHLAAKEMRGHVNGLEIRAPDHFEQEGFYVRAHIRNSKSLSEVAQRLQDVQNQAAALFDTVL